MSEDLSLEQDQRAQRLAKLASWRAAAQAFPNDVGVLHTAVQVQALWAEQGEEAAAEAAPMLTVHVAGRQMMRRLMGKASFVTMQDGTGRLQLYVRKDAVGEATYAAFKDWDLGDIIEAEGTLFLTQSGELSLRCTRVRLLVKALRPLPDKHHGLHDQALCYRQRYLDLLVNPTSRQRFLRRTAVIQAIRAFLDARDFLEVETPMMQPLAGGAAARPFATHHNTLDLPLYLRIAPELYLKRLVVGGFERVYEINRNFRNEGISTRHNPEFTMLEFYQAYATYEDLMDLSEVLLRQVAETVLGTVVLAHQGQTIDLAQPFRRLTMLEAILQQHPGLTAADLQTPAAAAAVAERLEVPISAQDGLGKIQLEIFEKTVEPSLQQPTFITAYPAEVSPLARRNDQDPRVTDRFELFIAGREIANGFSELNDPEDQAERFQAQLAAKAAGDEEAMAYDEDYIAALEVGLPPTAGEGIGIDRLVMLLTDAPSIRDVILFPLLRPEAR